MEQYSDSKRPSGILLNIKNLRFNLLEISGAMGDLGTFIPLSVAMAYVTGMDFGTILLFAGAANIITGILFGMPVPVQPMKAIAAVAIAEQLLPAEIAAAGIVAGMVIFLLGVTGLIAPVERFVPRSVVRGIQLGVGLKLMLKASDLVKDIPAIGVDSIAGAFLLFGLVLLSRKLSRFPSALILFLMGASMMLLSAPAGTLQFGLPEISIVPFTLDAWQTGVLRGALPQIPLTLLNSVLAICLLSGDLFPGRKISTRSMATSVGVMNLLSCPFGAMPVCHGSGGLAGQYHFGARTGGSVVMLGGAKLLAGLLFGASAIQLIAHFPHSILAVLLIFAGLELSLPARDQSSRRDFAIVIITAGGILAVNTLIGFSLGIVAAIALGKGTKNKAAY